MGHKSDLNSAATGTQQRPENRDKNNSSTRAQSRWRFAQLLCVQAWFTLTFFFFFPNFYIGYTFCPLSYSSLALLSISRMSMGLWSLQPLAWLGLCLSRAACWDRRVSSSTTLEEENQVLERPFLTQYDPRFWRPFSKDTGRLPHGNNAFLTIQNTEP